MAQRVAIQTADFNLAEEIETLRKDDPRIGAVCSFVGTVRDRNPALSAAVATAATVSAQDARSPPLWPHQQASEQVLSMELEHYPGMTEKAIEAMVDEAMLRFDIFGARVVHRVGLLQPLDQVVMVAVTSAHRGESFKACEFLMDYLKTQAPFWKKEQTPGGARWVDARVSDDAALAKWGIHASNV